MEDDAVFRSRKVRHQGGHADAQVDHIPSFQFRQRGPGYHQAGLIRLLEARRDRRGSPQILRRERGLDEAVNETAWGVDAIRRQLARLDDLLDFGDHQSGGGGGRLVKIVFRHAVLEIARRVRPPGADKSDIGPQRRNEHHLFAVYDPGLAPLPQGGAGASGREKTAQAGPAGAHGLRQ